MMPRLNLIFFFGLVYFVCVIAVANGQAPEDGDSLFPEFGEIQPPILMPADMRAVVHPDGHYLVDGQPRYLFGTISYNALGKSYQPTPGYPDSLKWLYERSLDYEATQRLGLDAAGVQGPPTWMKEFFPDTKPPLWDQEDVDATAKLIQEVRLPLYVDFTAYKWGNGWLFHDETAREKMPDAFNTGGIEGDYNHWVPYAALHPDGRAFWTAMWKTGIEFVRGHGGDVLFYELFNEPGYNDKSDYNRGIFADRMKAKFGSIEKLNAAWGSDYEDFSAVASFASETDHVGLCVEWMLFMEDAFVDLTRLGVETVREHDPDPNVGIAIQNMHWRQIYKANMNPYALNELLNQVSVTTGGTDFLEAHFYRSIARGKPIHDGEAYVQDSVDTFNNRFWTQMGRGINATFMFAWTKRGWDWKPLDENGMPSVEGAKEVGERLPYVILNPYRIPTEALTGIMKAKREMHEVGDLFFPRDRGVPSEVAVLISYPTERLARAEGNVDQNQVQAYAEALEFSHFPIDVIMEEHIAEGRLDEYRVMVGAGTDATYDATLAYVESWVDAGGVLILGLDTMSDDQYGRVRSEANLFDGLDLGEELPTAPGEIKLADDLIGYTVAGARASVDRTVSFSNDWAPVGWVGEAPMLFKRSVGQGFVYYVNGTMSVDSLSHVLSALMLKHQVEPECRLRLAQLDDGPLPAKVEANKARRNGLTAWWLYNNTDEPQMVRFEAPESLAEGNALIDPLSDVLYEADTDGSHILLLEPQRRKVVVAGPVDALVSRFKPLNTWSVAKATTVAESVIEEAKLEAERIAASRFTFDIDLNRARPLDLTEVANSSFRDQVGGDGQGGWTDQGAQQSLNGMTWGRQFMLGVPFDIIRWDHNQNNACIVLNSPKYMPHQPVNVGGIEVGDRVDRLFFLHASAWTQRNKLAWTYRLHRSDGSVTDIPILGDVEVGDWFRLDFTRGNQLLAKRAFENRDRHGLWAHVWENPEPDVPIESIEIVSGQNETIPIIVGITAELAGSSQNTEASIDSYFHNTKPSTPALVDDARLELSTTD